MDGERPWECPECARPVFSRRRMECEFCGATLPAELLLSDEERDDVHAARTREAAEAIERERELRRERRRRPPHVPPPPIV